jgi:hypothetical protein
MNTYNQYQKFYPMGMDQQTVAPVFQNNAAQQQNFQGLMGQGQKLAGQSLLPAEDQYDPKQLAQGLRNMGQTVNAYMPYTQNDLAKQYGTDPYSETTRMLAMQERGM